jgi:hypothetical protein
VTTTVTAAGQALHFPDSLKTDDMGVIEAPPADQLPAIADSVAPACLLLFAKRLIANAKKRRGCDRWRRVNQSKLVLAKLCLDRAIRDEYGGVMPPVTIPVLFDEYLLTYADPGFDTNAAYERLCPVGCGA